MNTEAEAKNKWCPMIRVHMTESAGEATNRYDDTGDRLNMGCVGSGCMMWQWYGWEKDIARKDMNKDNQQGRCGLSK